MKKIEGFILKCRKNELFDRLGIEYGWGNGYVIIPKGHKLHGIDYDELNNDVNVHGGLTYSDSAHVVIDDHLDLNIDLKNIVNIQDDDWVIGFDTVNGGETLLTWPRDRVAEEVQSLIKQIEEI